MNETPLALQYWGLVSYQEALLRQQELQRLRIEDEIPDTLVIVEHPSVVTLGLRGGTGDLRVGAEAIVQSGVALHHVNRGGFATAHEPGQLVAYPILRLKKKDLRWYSQTFLQSLAATLADYGLAAEFREGEPGLWVNGRKIASFGIAVRKWVSSHGIALNVANDLSTFAMIVPCGKPDEAITSMREELAQEVELAAVANCFIGHFCRLFKYHVAGVTENRE